MIAQLAWTLAPGARGRGDPGHHRRPADHLGDRAEPVRRQRAVGVRPHRPGRQLAVLRPEGRSARRPPGSPARWPRGGPMGTLDVGARSIAVNLDGTIVAAVSGGGAESVLESCRPRPPATVEEVSAARTTCCRRRGTWPAGCGWWTRRPRGAVFSAGRRRAAARGRRPGPERRTGDPVPGVPRRFADRGQRARQQRRPGGGEPAAPYDDRAASSGATQARRIALGGRRRAAHPRHRLDLPDVDRRAPPRGQRPVRRCAPSRSTGRRPAWTTC